MFNVEFIAFDDWQPHARVVRRLPQDFETLEEAMQTGTLSNSGVIPEAVGFRVLESNIRLGTPARVVAHRFRGL